VVRPGPGRAAPHVPEAATVEDHLIRIPFSQKAIANYDLRQRLTDPAITPSAMRILRPEGELIEFGDELTSMGEMTVSEHGGSLRTFNGGLAHECGWWPSRKARRLQHWQGTTQLMGLRKAETDHNAISFQTEARRFTFYHERWREYTCDLEVVRADGPDEIVEFKRDDRDLEVEDYALTLACVAEICRRVGLVFRVITADELFVDRHHRRNVELFASRRFVRVEPWHIRRLEAHGLTTGGTSTYVDLAHALEPEWPVKGEALVQGLVCQRRVEIDLTSRITAGTTVTIH